MSLLKKLENLSSSDTLPMHMPGHKRLNIGGGLPYSLDITEIDGFDDLHHRSGILKDLSEKAAKMRNAAYAFPLVNGSTVGILASIRALTNEGDPVIIARNCHKSIWHACEINKLNMSYIYPPLSEDGIFLSVKPEDVKKALENVPDAKIVVITSPTYEGIISDISEISETVHSYGAKLIVDAAHGAHLGYSKQFPKDAISLGADISIESLHKTLPSLTQTAILYTAGGIEKEKIEYALDIFETSSPSYILMASIEKCLDTIENDGKKSFEKYAYNLGVFYNSVSNLNNIHVVDLLNKENAFDCDRGKILISCKGTDISGSELADKLRKDCDIEPEAAYPDYIICMTSICDTEKGFERLALALTEIDSQIKAADKVQSPAFPKTKAQMPVYEALRGKSERIPISQLCGRISAEYLWAYPPGIPIIAPGEIITKELIDYIDYCKASGCNLIIPGRESTDEISVK